MWFAHQRNLPTTGCTKFYDRLLAVLRQRTVRDGQWQLLDGAPAWEENGTWDAFLIFAWQGPGKERLLVTVNYSATQSQCFVTLPFPEINNRSVQLKDSFSSVCYTREGNELLGRGLYLDLPSWSYHVFNLEMSQ